MKIKYQFANETMEINIAEEWGNIIIDLNREEYNNEHKLHRHTYSLDACEYEGSNFAVEDKAMERLFAEESDSRKLHAAVAKLKLGQQKLIRAVYFEGVSVNEYARLEGVDQSAISHRLVTARKNLKKLF